MRILIISDTHIHRNAEKLPSIIEEEAKNSDCCFHAGDFVTCKVFEQLVKWTKVYGVYGNMDEENVREKFPQKEIIKLENVNIGLIHGRGNPINLVEYINNEFAGELAHIDLIVFGHSHIPLDQEINAKIYFNPGSPTDKIFAAYRSYGILDIKDKEIKRRIVKIE